MRAFNLPYTKKKAQCLEAKNNTSGCVALTKQMTLEKLPNLSGARKVSSAGSRHRQAVLSLGSYDSLDLRILKGQDDERCLCDMLVIR